MQSSAIMYVAGAAVLVVLGAGAWMFMGGAAGNDSGGQAVEEQETRQETAAEAQTLKNLISYQGSQKCTFTSATSNSDSSGTVYVSNGQLRGDFVSLAQGATVESHLIVKGNTSYVWGGGLPGGFKMSFDSMSSAGASSGGMDPNAPVNYSCGAWAADQGMFELPGSIQFQDLNAMMNGMRP